MTIDAPDNIDFAEGLRLLIGGTAPDGSPVATYRTDLQGLGEATDSFYQPCANGLHLCGVTDDGEQPTTVGNWRLSPADAQAAFDWISDQVQEAPLEEADFILDLQLNGDNAAGLCCNRQHLSALLAKCEGEAA